ncbi:MAG: trypsin-like peptidase domain-containing protein [Burkholderiaceae bacterium]|nr:trypsin-like peptidase domain-containing protein [Burkholderiaceae bacterium]
MGLLLALACAAAQADMADLIPRVKPAVVMVGTYRATDSPRFGFRGSGFVVDDGLHVITNAHVLPDQSVETVSADMAVLVADGHGHWTQRKVESVRVDPSHDLAELKIDGAVAPALRLSDAPVREGQGIGLMGFPLAGTVGFTVVTHRGIVSAITAIVQPPPTSHALSTRAVRQLREGSFDVLQLDATAYPGNSGGPVFDAETGEVLGVVSMVVVKGTRESALSAPTGITYAVPAATVREFMQHTQP